LSDTPSRKKKVASGRKLDDGMPRVTDMNCVSRSCKAWFSRKKDLWKKPFARHGKFGSGKAFGEKTLSKSDGTITIYRPGGLMVSKANDLENEKKRRGGSGATSGAWSHLC